jgi:hypothetical protein
MTDKQETYATVSSRQGTLYVGCMNGRVFPRLNFPQRVGGFDIGATYRFDQGSPVMRIAPPVAGRSLYMVVSLGRTKHRSEDAIGEATTRPDRERHAGF